MEDVLAMLLRHCRAHLDTLRGLVSDAGARRHRARYAMELRAFLDDLDDVSLFVEDVDELRTRLVDQAKVAEDLFGPERGDVLVARAFADAIDRAFGPRLVDRYRHRGAYELRAEAPFPVPVPDLKTIFANDLGTRPESRGPALDETSHLRILNPPVRGLRVMLSTDYADVLATLSDESEVAVIWTTRLEDLVWHAETRGGEWWFRTVRPRPGFDATSDAITRLASVC
jgi:hypothetical protein